MFQLKDIDSLTQPVPTRLIRERSDMWHIVRDSAPVTGSSLHNAIGLRSLKEQKKHFDQKIDGIEVPFTEEVKTFMEHGVKNEPNAVATLVGKFLPMFYLSCNVSGVTCPVAIKSIISSFYAFFSQLNYCDIHLSIQPRIRIIKLSALNS